MLLVAGSTVAWGDHVFRLPTPDPLTLRTAVGAAPQTSSETPASPSESSASSSDASQPSAETSSASQSTSSSSAPSQNSASSEASSPSQSTSSSNTSSQNSSSPSSAPTLATPTTTAAPSAATEALRANRSLWLSSVATDGPGTGTENDPIDVSTSAKFDAFWKTQYQAHVSQGADSALFTLLPGLYHTVAGVPILSGWKINGSGQDSTTILGSDVVTYPTPGSKSATYYYTISAPNNYAANCAVENLTLDGNTLGLSTPLTDGFVMPLPGQSVTVSVANTKNLTVGKWVYVQDTAMTNGLQKWWGVMTVTAINGNHVTLQNAEIPVGGSITGQVVAGSSVVTNVSSTSNLTQDQTVVSSVFPGGSTIIHQVTSSTQVVMSSAATTTGRVTLQYEPWFTSNTVGLVLPTAHLFPYAPETGIEGLSGNNIMVESVTVQDVAVPMYEGPTGIWLCGGGPGIINGDVINNCTVKNVFGIFGWPLMLSSNNGSNSASQQAKLNTYVQGAVTNNTVIGNGYYQGIAMAGLINTTFSGNNVTNCERPFFCDTGYSSGITITHNVFEGNNPIFIGPGDLFNSSTISDNIITIDTSFCTGIQFTLNVENLVISGNTITAPGQTHSRGIAVEKLGAGMTGISVTGNVIESTLSNTATSPSYGTESRNVDEDGHVVLIGLHNLD